MSNLEEDPIDRVLNIVIIVLFLLLCCILYIPIKEILLALSSR